jgi:shikimate dehydrogenase
MTERAFVIGHPIAHSLSPHMHNAAFRAVGIDARYEAAEVAPAELASWVAAFRAQRGLGFNVTIPHKERMRPFVDVLEGDAQLAGAVNTVTWTNDSAVARLVGTNTDTVGFRRSLAEEAGVSLCGRHVAVLGAGGAARAIGVVALQDEAEELLIFNRTPERAEHLLYDLAGINGATRVAALPLTAEILHARLPAVDVLVNTTSVGMRSTELVADPSPLPAHALVVDIVYRPQRTALLLAAEACGLSCLGGLGMLIYQAAAAFERWTGQEAPIEVMRAAALAVLAEEDDHA